MGLDRYLKLSGFLNRLGYEIDLSTLESRISLQKRAYFAQLLGLSLDYSFGWYVFGPYSTELTREVYQFQGIESFVRPNEGDNEERARVFFGEVNALVTINKDGSYWLELLSSLHFLAMRAVPHLTDMEQCFSKLLAEKPGKFNREDMETAWNLLVKNELLPLTG